MFLSTKWGQYSRRDVAGKASFRRSRHAPRAPAPTTTHPTPLQPRGSAHPGACGCDTAGTPDRAPRGPTPAWERAPERCLPTGLVRSIACARHPWSVNALPVLPPACRSRDPRSAACLSQRGGPRPGSRLLRGMREQWGRRGCWPAAHMPPQGWAPAVPGTYRGNRPPAAPQNRSRAQGDAAQRLPFLPPSNLVYLVVAEINSAPNWELGAAAANPGRTQAPLPRSPPHQQNPAAADFEVGVVTLERAAPLEDHRPVETRQHPAGPAAAQSRAAGQHGGKRATKTQSRHIPARSKGAERLPPLRGGCSRRGDQCSSWNQRSRCSCSLPALRGWKTQGQEKIGRAGQAFQKRPAEDIGAAAPRQPEGRARAGSGRETLGTSTPLSRQPRSRPGHTRTLPTN